MYDVCYRVVCYGRPSVYPLSGKRNELKRAQQKKLSQIIRSCLYKTKSINRRLLHNTVDKVGLRGA